MGRTPCCDPSIVKKGVWTIEEDKKLIDYVATYGCSNWRQLPKYAGSTTRWPLCTVNTKLLHPPAGWRCPLEPHRLLRCGKSCRLRWLNYLSPNIRRGNFTQEEEETIIRLHESLGNRWSAIAAKLPGRTDNEIKNHWNTNIKKRVKQKLVTDKAKPTSEEDKADHHNSNSLRIAATQTTDGSLLQPTDFSNNLSKYVTGQGTATPPIRESFMLPSLSLSDDLSSMTFDSEPVAADGKELIIYEDVFAFLDAYEAPPTSESFEVFMDGSKSTELTTLETDLSSMNSNSSSGDLWSSGENLTCDDVSAFLEGYKAPVESSLSESSWTSNEYNTYSDDGFMTPLIDVAIIDFSSTNS